MSDEKQRPKELIDYLYLLLKWRWFIAVNFLLVVLITYGITLMLPKWYYSESIVLPPRDKGAGGLMGMGSLARMVGLGGPAGLMGHQEVYSYMSILKSRSLQEQIINEFDLMEVYKIDNDSMEDALKELRGNLQIRIDEEGALVVGIHDKDPERAADITNRFVELLHDRHIELGVYEARSRRRFLERRLDQNKVELADLEQRLHEFQSNHGLIVLPDQSEKGIAAVAEMYAMKALKEMEVEIFRETMGADNPFFRSAQMELSVINRRLEAVPDQTIESIRLLREFLIQQKIFEFLTPMLEEARLEELRDTPTVLILDRAVPAEEKSRPKRLLITLAMGVVSLIFSIGYVVSSEHIHTVKSSNPERYRVIEKIGSILRNPFKRV
jgi:tyrosine-protein kinase Etk/Wzc